MDSAQRSASQPRRSTSPRWLLDPETLRQHHTQQGRRRPRIHGWEREEQVYHYLVKATPAWAALQRQCRAGPQEHFELWFMDWLAAGGSIHNEWQQLRLTELVESGSPWECAVTYLCYRLPLSKRTVDTYAWRSARRHREDLCLLYGKDCLALGALPAIPDSDEMVTWLKRWESEPLTWRTHFAPLPADR